MSNQHVFPRIRNRIQIRPMGIISGLIGGIGMMILLQQFAVIIPTRTVLIAGPLIGVVSSVVLNTLGRALGARRLNKMLDRAEEAVRRGESASVAESGASAWAPTHVIPQGGLDAFEIADASGEPVSHVDEGLEVQIVEQQGDWANVVFSNGWSAWVDGRSLVQN